MRTKHTPCNRRRAAALIAATLLFMADPGHAREPRAAYALTIKNLNAGQSFSPPIIILHGADYRLPVFATELEASNDLLVSVAAMLSLTNDGFVAARSVPLPDEVAATTTVALRAFDAGSEANTESCAHVPCESHDQRMTEGAEGFASEHSGIGGDADLSLSRGWIGPELGNLTITRLR